MNNYVELTNNEYEKTKCLSFKLYVLNDRYNFGTDIIDNRMDFDQCWFNCAEIHNMSCNGTIKNSRITSTSIIDSLDNNHEFINCLFEDSYIKLNNNDCNLKFIDCYFKRTHITANDDIFNLNNRGIIFISCHFEDVTIDEVNCEVLIFKEKIIYDKMYINNSLIKDLIIDEHINVDNLMFSNSKAKNIDANVCQKVKIQTNGCDFTNKMILDNICYIGVLINLLSKHIFD